MFVFLPWFLQNLIWLPTRLILDLVGNLKIYGLENLRGVRGAIIFASNHSSEMDPILLPAALPWFSHFLPMFYVSREKEFYNIKRLLKRIFYGGVFFEMWGAYKAIAGLHNYEASLKSHIKILNAKQSVMIFPEGRKSFDGKIHMDEVRGGAAYLSYRTGAPIVPVSISGVYRITPTQFFTGRYRLVLSIGRPIYPNELFGGRKDVNPHEHRIIVREKVIPEIVKLIR